MLDKLLDVLLGVVIFVALFGFILTSLNGISWATLNIAGTVRDFSWAPYVLILLIVIGLIYLGYTMIGRKHK